MILFPFKSGASHTIRFWLGLLVAACGLPMLLMAGLLSYHVYDYKRSLVAQRMADTARALSISLEQDLSGVRQQLQILAMSPHLKTGDMGQFHALARRIASQYPHADIILADKDGQQLINTYRDYGEALPSRNSTTLARIFATGDPVISDLFYGAITKRPLVSVDVPVLIDGRVTYDLAMTFPAEHLATILFQQRLPRSWTATILDSRNITAARTEEAEHFIGRPLSADLQDMLAQQDEGQGEVVNAQGIAMHDAFVRSPALNWTVVVGVPDMLIQQEIWEWLGWMLIALFTLIAVALVLITLIAEGIARSIHALAAPALALGQGQPVPPQTHRLKETQDVSMALLRASQSMALREQERDQAIQALAERRKALQYQYEGLRALNDIAALPEQEPNLQLGQALALGARHLGLPIGIISRLDGSNHTIRLHHAPVGTAIQDNETLPMGDTYCARTMRRGDVLALDVLPQPCRGGSGCCDVGPSMKSFIGAPLMVMGQSWGTVSYSSVDPHPRPFDDSDRDFMRLLARWIGVTLERQSVHQELARSNAELEQFAHAASHDLRSPLHQIRGKLSLLERHHGDALPAEARDLVGEIGDGISHMDNLIHGLSDYSHIGRHERPHGPVSLDQIMDGLQTAQAAVIAQTNASLTVVKPLPVVTGDREELEQLFQNLISNAIKYSDPSRPPQIRIAAIRAGQNWDITVSDNGIGIAPADQNRIFGLFQHLHGIGQTGDIGIGLAACRKIAEHHGGTITVSSELGQGSRFTVSLPTWLLAAE